MHLLRNPTGRRLPPPDDYDFVVRWDPVDHWHVIARFPTRHDPQAVRTIPIRMPDGSRARGLRIRGRAQAEPYVVRGCQLCESLMNLPGYTWRAPWPAPLPRCAVCTLPIPAKFQMEIDDQPYHIPCATRTRPSVE
jgi:hypothetical protein